MKTALVSGASSEIGAAICRKLSNNYTVVALYRDKERYSRFCGDSFNPFLFDVTNNSDFARLEPYFKNNNLPLPSILVNCAGININAMSYKMDEHEFIHVLNTNIVGTFRLTKQIIPYMKENKWGRIVNISSITADRGAFGASAYSASKGAINSFTKSVAKEVGRNNITVNSISLGYMITGMVRDIPKSVLDDVIAHTALNRLGSPEEAANVVSFLCSEEASFVTGAVIPVTGGYY